MATVWVSSHIVGPEAVCVGDVVGLGPWGAWVLFTSWHVGEWIGVAQALRCPLLPTSSFPSMFLTSHLASEDPRKESPVVKTPHCVTWSWHQSLGSAIPNSLTKEALPHAFNGPVRQTGSGEKQRKETHSVWLHQE